MDLTLEARAIPIDPVRWIASPVRTSRYQLVKSQLKLPVVTPPGGYYPYNSFPSVVTIVNPNPAGSSEIMYRFGSTGSFIKYNPSAPPALSKDNYQTTLTVYARSLMSSQYLDSNEGQELYETIYFSGATNGLFHNPTPDSSGNPKNLVTNLPAPKKAASSNGAALQGIPA